MSRRKRRALTPEVLPGQMELPGVLMTTTTKEEQEHGSQQQVG